MERKTFRILFLLRKSRTGKNGLAPILARITTNGLQSEIYIQCHVNPAKWNQTKERATGSDRLSCQVNACLDDFRARVLEIRQELIEEGYEGHAIQIKERFTHHPTDREQVSPDIPLSDCLYPRSLRKRGYIAVGSELRVHRQLQHLSANPLPVQAQRGCQSAVLSQELHFLLSEKRMDHEESV